MPEENKISFTVNTVPTKKNSAMDGMIALKKIEHFSYALTDQIGLGYSSHVYKGKNDKTNEIVAIKVIDIKKEDELHRQFTNSEVSILEKIKNISPEHLLKLEGVFKTKNNLYIITEFCEGKDLAKILRKKKFFNEQESQGIMKQFLKGYAELYTINVVHRDLKLANIFIRKGKAILADFGFAIESDKCTQKFDYNVGSPFYMPPQSLKFNRYSYKSDVWAIGVIAYELMYGQRPWKQKDDDILYEKIMTTSIDTLFDPSVKISEPYKQFIRECLQIDFDKRASPEFVINFEWRQSKDYIDGLEQNNFSHPRTVSIPKIQYNALPYPNSTKNMSYKPIHFEDLRQNQILKNQNSQIPVSLMGRQPSPLKDQVQNRKKNISSMAQIKPQQESNYQYQNLQDKKPRKQTSIENLSREKISQEDTQKVILAQIQYCRFLSLIFGELRNSGLQQLRQLGNQICKKIIDRIEFLSNLQFDQQNEPIPGLRQYMGGSRWKMLSQMIRDYREKYYRELAMYVTRETPQISIESISKAISILKPKIQTHQRLIELLAYLYQVTLIEINFDIVRFWRESKIDYLAQNRNINPNPLNTQRLIQKLDYLNL